MAAADEWSASPEDVIEQQTPVGEDNDEDDIVATPAAIPDDIPEADALEQLEVVPLDDDVE